jgi:hypothetical protein
MPSSSSHDPHYGVELTAKEVQFIADCIPPRSHPELYHFFQQLDMDIVLCRVEPVRG